MAESKGTDTARTPLVAGTASHVGKSTVAADLCRVLADRVLGTYLHGILENERAREAFVAAVREAAGVATLDADAPPHSPFDVAADALRDHVDLTRLLDG